MYAYYNNGLSFRLVANDYVAHDDEVIFSSIANPEQLEKAFSGYTSAINASNWRVYQNQAVVLLQEGGKTIERIVQAVVAGRTNFMAKDVVDFCAWMDSLRAIINVELGDPTQPLPTKPPYPVGT